jgi:predicted nucleic acid-binding protein
VKAYLDSGVFIDFLTSRGQAFAYLRSTKRRGRDPERLRTDAEECLATIRDGHIGTTSAIIAWELEEAMYGELVRRSLPGEPITKHLIIRVARDLVTHTLLTLDQCRIELVDLTRVIVTAQCGHVELQRRAIRSADALHITTALAEGAELLITTDSNLISLDSVFENAAGALLWCVDTDHALSLLA